MLPRVFEYFRPKTLEEALQLLSKYKGEAKVLAGGQSLIPIMKLRLASPKYLIDINGLQNLSYQRTIDGHLALGCLVRHKELESFEAGNTGLHVLRDAASLIGDPQVRNMGTFGGSLAHADPSADWPAVALALRAEIKVKSVSGERKIKAEDFFTGPFSTSMNEDELITEISIPLVKGRAASSYQKLERKAGDFALVGAAAFLMLDENSVCTKAGIGLTSVADKPVIAKKAEELLVGRKIDERSVEDACQTIREAINPPSDVRGSSEYRKEMAVVLAKRAILTSLRRISGG
jgi:carbon-monoxide dehydrogenase medium subunit